MRKGRLSPVLAAMPLKPTNLGTAFDPKFCSLAALISEGAGGGALPTKASNCVSQGPGFALSHDPLWVCAGLIVTGVKSLPKEEAHTGAGAGKLLR